MISKLIVGILVLGSNVGLAPVDADQVILVQIVTDDCVSGEMQVEEQTKGIIRVSELLNGDVIRGITGADQTPGWCKVEGVFLRANGDNATTYEGFTEQHMVVEDDIVRPYEKKGKAKETRIFTVATECDAAVNVEGQEFTPISTTFCPHELSWSEYLPLIAAIRRVTYRTGYFWYSSDAFYDNKTAKVPHWMDMLHDMCTEMLRCAREGQCQKFENLVEEFVHAHLNKTYMAIVDRVFPNIGGDVEKSEAGTISEVVRPRGRSHIIGVVFSAVGVAVALALVIVIIAFPFRRKRFIKKKKEMKEPQQSHPPVIIMEDVKV